MQHAILNDSLILLAVAIVTVTLVRRLGLPTILGYLAVGLIAGPHGLGWLAFDEVTRFFGELGIVFLLFSIGLEFSLPLLLSLRRYLLGVGSVQVAVGTVSGFLVARAFGVDWPGALVLGAVAVRTLERALQRAVVGIERVFVVSLAIELIGALAAIGADRRPVENGAVL